MILNILIILAMICFGFVVIMGVVLALAFIAVLIEQLKDRY